jgi:hypothetical protein
MVWDDELRFLARSVAEMFGDDALGAAAARAMEAWKHSPSPVSHAESVTSTGRPADAIESAGFQDCLRAELKRLLRPH